MMFTLHELYFFANIDNWIDFTQINSASFISSEVNPITDTFENAVGLRDLFLHLRINLNKYAVTRNNLFKLLKRSQSIIFEMSGLSFDSLDAVSACTRLGGFFTSSSEALPSTLVIIEVPGHSDSGNGKKGGPFRHSLLAAYSGPDNPGDGMSAGFSKPGHYRQSSRSVNSLISSTRLLAYCFQTLSCLIHA